MKKNSFPFSCKSRFRKKMEKEQENEKEEEEIPQNFILPHSPKKNENKKKGGMKRSQEGEKRIEGEVKTKMKKFIINL